MKSLSDNGRRMSCSLVILGLLRKVLNNLEEQDKSPEDYLFFFSMLYFMPRQEPMKNSADLSIVLSFIPSAEHSVMADVLVYFVNKVLEKGYTLCERLEWLYVIPLIHILKGQTKPFDDPTVILDEIKWMDDNVNLLLLKQQANFSASRYCL